MGNMLRRSGTVDVSRAARTLESEDVAQHRKAGIALMRKAGQFSSASREPFRGAHYTDGMASGPNFLPARVRTSVPAPTPLSQALQSHAGLRALTERLQASERRLALIRRAMPGTLSPHIEAGPLDEECWTVLVANAAVAAKLRQLLPRLESALNQAGYPQRMRIKLKQA
ncbi:DciA family protein [Roseateles sp. BYS87W]|uniref:DciA family protein n=1 Tax=Pelomonas baiyunensis TaxID=3299026 RepID=A0ABW7H321_9BURK